MNASGEDIASEMAILGSRTVVATVIDSFGLPTLFPDIAASPPASGTPTDAAVEAFNRALAVEPVKMSSIISVRFDAPTAAMAREVVDRLVAAYLRKHADVFAARRTDGYEDARDRLRTELDDAQALLSRLKLDGGIYDIAAQRAALITRRADAESRLADARGRDAALRDRVAFLLAQRRGAAPTVRSTVTDQNDEAAHAREALSGLQQAEAALAARLGDANPELQRFRSQIAAARGTATGVAAHRTNVATAPSPAAQALDRDLVLARAELAPLPGETERLAALAAGLDNELRRLEAADLRLRTVAARIDVLTDGYRAAQARFEAARTREQTELAREVSVVQVAPATGSDKPVGPRRLAYGAAGLLAGLLLAGAIGAGTVLCSTTVSTGAGLERLLGLPVLATLPHDKRGRRVVVE